MELKVYEAVQKNIQTASSYAGQSALKRFGNHRGRLFEKLVRAFCDQAAHEDECSQDESHGLDERGSVTAKAARDRQEKQDRPADAAKQPGNHK